MGSRIGARAQLSAFSEVPAGTQLVTTFTIEVEGGGRPACVAETVALLLG